MTYREIPWWKPEIVGSEISLLQGVLESNFLNEGDVTTAFETELAVRLGVRYAISATSGTAALYLALLALGIGPGDEVVVPDVTFIATANAVTMTGASVILADIEPRTLSMSAASLQRSLSSRTRAVIPVHVSGRAGSLRDVLRVAEENGIPVVEDAAEALGSCTENRALGSFGKMGCFSFSPNKTISTGQGGMIVTDEAGLARRLRELKDQGRPVRGTGGDDVHPTLGFNFKFTNLQAAVGLAQLTALDGRLRRQARISEVYAEELGDCPGIDLFPCHTSKGEIPQWTDALARRRDHLDEYLRARNVHCRRFWHPLHRQPPYRQNDSSFPVSSELGGTALWLPSAFQMTETDVRYVSSLIREFYRSQS